MRFKGTKSSDFKNCEFFDKLTGYCTNHERCTIQGKTVKRRCRGDAVFCSQYDGYFRLKGQTTLETFS